MNEYTLLSVFGEFTKHLKFDRKLLTSLEDFKLKYISSNRDRLQFYGGNLLGTHRIFFTDADIDTFFDILQIDQVSLQEAIYKCPEIDPDFEISSDVYNLTCMYLIHRFITSQVLNGERMKAAARVCGLLFFYRCMAALHSHYFQYLADPKIMQATYANLSKKFLIKQLGTWQKVMEYRADALVDPKKPERYRKLENFSPDYDIVLLLNEAQGALRSIMKYYYSVYIETKEANETIHSATMTGIDVDGEEVMKDRVQSVDMMINALKLSMTDRDGFARKELIQIVNQMNKNTSESAIRSVLWWMHAEYNQPTYHKLVDEFMSLVVVQSNYFMQEFMPGHSYTDFPYIMVKLKNKYLSTRSTDEELTKINELGERIVRLANGKSLSKSLVFATRTSLILFLSLRALVGNKR